MAKKAGSGPVTVHLECTSCRTSGMPGVSRYSIKKNKRKHPQRFEFRKYCKFERKHTVHKEVK